MQIYDEAFVEKFLSPWNAHDVDGAMALMTEDCIWEVTRGAELHGARFEGSQAVREAITNAFAALPDIRYEPVHTGFGPDLVVLKLLVTYTLSDVNTVRFHACDIMTIKDGKVAAKRSYRKGVE